MRWLAYDLEIKHCVPNKNEERKPNLKYCFGWGDKAGMGISVLTAYDSSDRMFHVYMDDNKEEFRKRVEAVDLVVGFSSKTFDDKVVEACWKFNIISYDILAELKSVAGKDGVSKLDDYGYENFNVHKTMSGALAPELWQTQQLGKLIDYCLQDTWTTARLFQKILRHEPIINPKTRPIILEIPSIQEDLELSEKQDLV